MSRFSIQLLRGGHTVAGSPDFEGKAPTSWDGRSIEDALPRAAQADVAEWLAQAMEHERGRYVRARDKSLGEECVIQITER